MSVERFELAEPHMGTLFRVVFYAEDATAGRAALARVAELNAILSDYLPESELNRLSTRWQRVSPELRAVLEASARVWRESGGAFDITVKSKVRGQVEIDGDRVRLSREGLRLDLGGIGKGYAADEALRLMRDRGVARALVAASGDIAVGAGRWRVAIEPAADYARVLELTECGVSTSGDRERLHIVDPRTGKLVGRIGATVIAKQAIWSDALATAVCVLGVDAGVRLCERFGATVFVKAA